MQCAKIYELYLKENKDITEYCTVCMWHSLTIGLREPDCVCVSVLRVCVSVLRVCLCVWEKEKSTTLLK